jgi:hypothetical protein
MTYALIRRSRSNPAGLLDQIDRDANAREEAAQEILEFLQEHCGGITLQVKRLTDLDRTLGGRLEQLINAQEYDEILSTLRQQMA